jgi:hypothetical protein
MHHASAREWIEHEDDVARADRIARLEWLATNDPSIAAGFLVHGGWLSNQLLEEARYCFAYGQFLASAILGVAFMERVLAAQFYAAGRDDLERAGGLDLLREALKTRWISQEEFEQFDRVRRLRNPLVHFRRPLAPDTVEYRAVQQNAHPDEVVQSDAQEILQVMFRVLQGGAV